MNLNQNPDDIYCYEYLDKDGDIEVIILDSAGAPSQKNKISTTLSNYKKPKANEIYVTKLVTSMMVGATKQQNVFEYCLAIEQEGIVCENLEKYSDDDWYSMFTEIEREIPLTGARQITYH